ncbi:MAG: hypothetical protein OXP75_11395, partial [Rhodospirillales bacterium]|nr:hypothetical protein [Rhodospirillales bacterium]
FSSRGPAFAAVERLKAEGLSTVEAIDRLADGAHRAGGGSTGGDPRRAGNETGNRAERGGGNRAASERDIEHADDKGADE